MTLRHGDCIEVMRGMPDASVDAIVTDPPAGISFMGKSWDHHLGGRDAWVTWMTAVMTECYRLLKPGGHILVWALPRTSHWTGWAIESAGFEPRDKLIHCFASGFPKSLDVSKAIDRAAGAERTLRVNERWAERYPNGPGGNLNEGSPDQQYGQLGRVSGNPLLTSDPVTDAARQWDGWGTALKPAYEDWWLARKPLAGTVASTVLRYGTGALNIGGCRIGTDGRPLRLKDTGDWVRPDGAEDFDHRSGWAQGDTTQGRWPANVILTATEDGRAIFDGGVEGVVGGGAASRGGDPVDVRGTGGIWHDGNGVPAGPQYGDTGTYSRFFELPKGRRAVPSDGRILVCQTCGVTNAELPSTARTQTANTAPPSVGTSLGEQSDQLAFDAGDQSERWSTDTAPRPARTSLSRVESESTPTVPPTTSGTENASLPSASDSTSLRKRSPESRPSGPSPRIDPASDAALPETSSDTTTITTDRWMCDSCAEVAMAAFTQDASLDGTADSPAARGTYPKFLLIPKSSRSDREPVVRGQLAERRVDTLEDNGDTLLTGSGNIRRAMRANSHPTVKATELMRHLVRLICPPGGTVLDPFAGSGSTLIAAEQEGFAWIGIEQSAEYVAIAEARLNGTQRGLGLDVPAPTRKRSSGPGYWPEDGHSGPNAWFTTGGPRSEDAP